jgi:hypothetical protein
MLFLLETCGDPEQSEKSLPVARVSNSRGKSPKQRGYGGRHQGLRKRWAPRVARGLVPCARCGLPMEPGEPWDLDHSTTATATWGLRIRGATGRRSFEAPPGRPVRRPPRAFPQPRRWHALVTRGDTGRFHARRAPRAASTRRRAQARCRPSTICPIGRRDHLRPERTLSFAPSCPDTACLCGFRGTSRVRKGCVKGAMIAPWLNRSGKAMPPLWQYFSQPGPISLARRDIGGSGGRC